MLYEVITRRGDFANASTIVIPGDPYLEEGPDHSDARNIKSLLSIGRRIREAGNNGHRPLLVASDHISAFDVILV